MARINFAEKQTNNAAIKCTSCKLMCTNERRTLPEYLLQGGGLRCTTTCGHHQEVPAGWQNDAVEHDSFTYVRGTPAVFRNACRENSLLAEGALREGPAGFWNHASMNPPKDTFFAPAAPKTRAYLRQPSVNPRHMTIQATLRLILSPI